MMRMNPVSRAITYPFRRFSATMRDVNLSGRTKTVFATVVFVSVFGYGGYNAYLMDKLQKSSSSLVKGLGYYIRHDPRTTDLVGVDAAVVDYSASGELNLIKGVADISFVMKGEKGPTNVHYTGHRERGDWISSRFDVVPESNPDKAVSL